MAIAFLHTNDLHGALDERAAEKLAELRTNVDFFFDSGDCVASGNLGVPSRPDGVWNLLSRAACTAGVPGNREFHISRRGFRAKLAGCGHPVLAANLRWRSRRFQPLLPASPGEMRLRPQDPLASSVLIGAVGVFGVMVPMVTPGMAARHLSAFVNDPPVQAAQACVKELRGRCEVLMCLSHIGLKKDIELAEAVPEIDVILGGHSHTVLAEPVKVGSTWVCQGGSHARFVGVYRWEGGRLTGGLRDLRE